MIFFTFNTFIFFPVGTIGFLLGRRGVLKEGRILTELFRKVRIAETMGRTYGRSFKQVVDERKQIFALLEIYYNTPNPAGIGHGRLLYICLIALFFFAVAYIIYRIVYVFGYQTSINFESPLKTRVNFIAIRIVRTINRIKDSNSHQQYNLRAYFELADKLEAFCKTNYHQFLNNSDFDEILVTIQEFEDAMLTNADLLFFAEIIEMRCLFIEIVIENNRLLQAKVLPVLNDEYNF